VAKERWKNIKNKMPSKYKWN